MYEEVNPHWRFSEKLNPVGYHWYRLGIREAIDLLSYKDVYDDSTRFG